MISYKFSDTLLFTRTTSQMITDLSALKQLFHLRQYFVDQRCRKGLSGRFSIGLSQEVAVRCGLGSTEGSTGLAIQDVPLTRPAAKHWAGDNQSANTWLLPHGSLGAGPHSSYFPQSELPKKNWKKLHGFFWASFRSSPVLFPLQSVA